MKTITIRRRELILAATCWLLLCVCCFELGLSLGASTSSQDLASTQPPQQ